MQTELEIPQVMKDQCAALGVPVTGNSVGKMSLTEFPGAVRGPYPQILGWRPKGIGALAGCILTALLGECPLLSLARNFLRSILRQHSCRTSFLRAALLTCSPSTGMATVVWYAMGGQLDADELHEEVVRELEKKKKGGLIKRGVKSAFGRKK